MLAFDEQVMSFCKFQRVSSQMASQQVLYFEREFGKRSWLSIKNSQSFRAPDESLTHGEEIFDDDYGYSMCH